MLALKFVLMILGLSLFSSAGALVAYDIYLSTQLGRLLGRGEISGSTPRTKAVEVGESLSRLSMHTANREPDDRERLSRPEGIVSLVGGNRWLGLTTNSQRFPSHLAASQNPCGWPGVRR